MHSQPPPVEIECDEVLLLSIFEDFLKDPAKYITKVDALIYESGTVPGHLLHSDTAMQRWKSHRWHTLAFISEFILSPVIVGRLGNTGLSLQGADYLNWSGKQFYKRLKDKEQKQPK